MADQQDYQAGGIFMTSEGRQKWLPLALIAVALATWGVFIALGVYFEPSADQPKHDLRKALIVAGGVGAFLLFWGIALAYRSYLQRPK
jgi:hypothetical protein